MLILSYATKDKKYLDYANRLIQNFADLKYKKYKIIYYPQQQNKFTGCNLKPTFILEQLQYYKKQILIIDVDSIIKEYPSILNYDNFDIGLVYTPEKKNKVTNSIHLWNYTNNTINFLKRWKELCDDKTLSQLDHHKLIRTISQFDKQLKFIDIRKDISNWFKAELSKNNIYLTF